MSVALIELVEMTATLNVVVSINSTTVMQTYWTTPFIGDKMPALDKDEYTYEEFIGMVKANPDLAAVRVHKQRFGYMVNNTICEVGNVLINGAKIVTINSESTEIEDIKKTIADCGLEGVENINYLQAIKRVIGMSDKPLANE